MSTGDLIETSTNHTRNPEDLTESVGAHDNGAKDRDATTRKRESADELDSTDQREPKKFRFDPPKTNGHSIFPETENDSSANPDLGMPDARAPAFDPKPEKASTDPPKTDSSSSSSDFDLNIPGGWVREFSTEPSAEDDHQHSGSEGGEDRIYSCSTQDDAASAIGIGSEHGENNDAQEEASPSSPTSENRNSGNEPGRVEESARSSVAEEEAHAEDGNDEDDKYGR